MALHHIRFSVLFSSDAVKYRFTSVALSLYRHRSQSICSGDLNPANIAGHKYYYCIVFYCIFTVLYLKTILCVTFFKPDVSIFKVCWNWNQNAVLLETDFIRHCELQFYLQYPIMHSILNWVNLVIPSCCSNGTVCMHH